MRLWSLHPSLLDRAALVAGWREALLAQKVLRGETTGYRHHPQLERFRRTGAAGPAPTSGAGDSAPAPGAGRPARVAGPTRVPHATGGPDDAPTPGAVGSPVGTALAPPTPAALIAAYLHGLADEADRRGYRFRRELVIALPATDGALTVTSGQLDLELEHLRRKVSVRAPEWLDRLDRAAPHPLFVVVDGPVEPWERATS